MTLRARDRRARRELSERVSSLSGRRSIISVSSLFDALIDPSISHGVYELLALSAASAVGQTNGRRECFVCCRPWAPTFAPVGVMTAEMIGAAEALVSLICGHCFGDQSALFAALRRDLGIDLSTARVVHESPTGRQQ